MMGENGQNVLLIGKYPPLQGGISAKTYWLVNHLTNQKFNFRIVTTKVGNYSNAQKEKDKFTFYPDKKSIPWHIPSSDLLFDQLLNECLEVLNDFKPDIIETNYLWPFCSVALFLSKSLNKPLLIRHAGSDILKFYSDLDFRKIMKFYFNQSDQIATNTTCNKIIHELCDDNRKVRLLPRFVPDPDFFHEIKCNKKYDILFAGKINYHWNLKGIEHLLDFIKFNNLRGLFLVDGNYIKDLYSRINERGLLNSVETKKFVHPSKMPEIINKCKSVWCWEDKRSIQDFSNIISEACFCNVPCFINSHSERLLELKTLTKLYPELIIPIDPKKIISAQYSIPEKYPERSVVVESKQRNLFLDYISQNLELYQSLAK